MSAVVSCEVDSSEMATKMALERAMMLKPADQTLRADYFACLERLSSGRTGLSFALLPELGAPLYFRCGTTDLANLVKVFVERCYEVELKAEPVRILDLGAYAGYAAIYWARRFPHADILCLEPMADNFRLLMLNTLPYRQIYCRQAAVWRHATQLSARSIHGGDAGRQLIEAGDSQTGGIAALSVADLLRDVNWHQVDLIKCDIAGAEAQVFADPLAPWLNTLDALVVEAHDELVPGASKMVAACFDPRSFRHFRYRDKQVFERSPPLRAALAVRPNPVWVINPGTASTPFVVQDVAPVPWGFFVFSGTSCQLHPNPPGHDPAARAFFPLALFGQTRLTGTVWHAGEQSPPIRFLVAIEAADGHLVVEQDYILSEGESRDIALEFSALTGRCRVVLQTEMAPGQSVNANAWARWLNLQLS